MSDKPENPIEATEAEAAEIAELEKEQAEAEAAKAAKAEPAEPEKAETPDETKAEDTKEDPKAEAAETKEGETPEAKGETPEAKAEEPESPEEPEAKAPEEISPLDARFVPRFQGEVKDFTEEVDAARGELAEAEKARNEALAKIKTDLDAGELSSEEATEKREEIRDAFYEAKDTVRDKLTSIQLEEAKQKTRIELAESAAEQSWAEACAVFYDQNEGYRDNPILKGALASALETLYADEANANRSDIWFLHQAQAKVEAAFNNPAKAEEKGEQPAATIGTKPPPARRPDVKDIPPNLGSVPAASEVISDSSEYKKVDDLAIGDMEEEVAHWDESKVKEFLDETDGAAG